MAQANWTLVSKLRPERAEDHARLTDELAQTRKELKSVGILGRLLVPSKGRKHIELKARVAKLEREIAGCYGPVGYDLEPPRIGFDEKATKWYREYLSKDPDAWPLSVDEMIDEMKGQPVWELSDYGEIQHLDVGWPKGGFPVPAGPGFTADLSRRLSRTLTPEEATELAAPLSEAVIEFFRLKYTPLANAQPQEVVQAVIRGAAPGGPPGSLDARDVELAHMSLSASSWLRFWGSHGYTLKHSAPTGG